MNTLTLIKKQIEKAAALHDAQIAMTTYRGVKFECKQGANPGTRSTFCYRGHTYTKRGNYASMYYKLASLGSIFSIAFLGLLYGELTLLHKK